MRALVMSLRTAVIAHRRPIALDGLRGTPTPGGPVATRKVWFDSQSNNWHDTPIYRREGLPAGAPPTRPALVGQAPAPTGIEPRAPTRGGAVGNPQNTGPATRDDLHLSPFSPNTRQSES